MEEKTAVGVPDRVPVAASNRRPVGKEGEIENRVAAGNPYSKGPHRLRGEAASPITSAQEVVAYERMPGAVRKRMRPPNKKMNRKRRKKETNKQREKERTEQEERERKEKRRQKKETNSSAPHTGCLHVLYMSLS